MILSYSLFVQISFYLTLTLSFISALIVAVSIFWSTNVSAKNFRSFAFHSMTFLTAWSIISFSEISMWAEIQWMCTILLKVFKCFSFVIMRCSMNWSNCCFENLMTFIAAWLSMKIIIENCCVSIIFSANSSSMNFSKYTVSFVKSSTYLCLFFIIIDVFFLLKWKSSSRKLLFYFLCHCHSWISLNNCFSWFDHEFRRLLRRLKLWWFSMIVIKKMLKKKFNFRNWLCFFWISWRIWFRICAVNLIEHIEFFDAELLRTFMRDLRVFFDCVCVRRWDW